MVRQLKRLNVQIAALNTKTDALNTKTGDTQVSPGSVRGLLTIICDYTAPVNCKPRRFVFHASPQSRGASAGQLPREVLLRDLRARRQWSS